MSENAIGTLNTDSYRSATHGMIDRLPDLSPDAQGWQRLRIMQNVNALCDEVDRLRVEVRRLQAIEAAAREYFDVQYRYRNGFADPDPDYHLESNAAYDALMALLTP